MSEYVIDQALDVPFTVDSDTKADWCLRKIAEIERDAQKWRKFYAAQCETIDKQAEANKAYFLSLLEAYFGTVPHKATRTQESYALPGGKLIRKAQQPTYTRDDAQLLPWARENNLVRVKEEPDWSAIKKRSTLVNGQTVDAETGEIIPGVTVLEREQIFTVSIKEG